MIPYYVNKLIRKLNEDTTIIEMNITFVEIGEQYVFSKSLSGGKPSQVYINDILQSSNNDKYNIQTINNNKIKLVWNYVFTDCRYMFSYLTNIKELIFLKFDDSSLVTNMGAMFRGCTSLQKLDLTILNTEKVTNIGHMFNLCESLTSLDVSNFNTNNIGDINNFINGCSSLTSLNVSNFNISTVGPLHSMFSTCENLQFLDLSNIHVREDADIRNIFRFNSNLKYIKLNNYSGKDIFGSIPSEQKIICSNKFNELKNSFSSFSNAIEGDCSLYPFNKIPQNLIIKINNIGYQNIFSNEFVGNKISEILVNGNEQEISDDGKYQLNDIINDITIFWYKTPLNDTRKMFYRLTNILEINFKSFDTSSVTHMGNMFEGCSNLLSVDISVFDTSNVEYSFNMFKDCYSLESLDLSNFNTSIIVDFGQMFRGCSSLLSINFSNFKANKILKFDRVFEGCHSLRSLNLSNFNVENVEIIEFCFSDCINLEILDLSNFITSQVTYFKNIFFNCQKLKYIKLFSYTGIDIFESLIQNKIICTNNYEEIKIIAPSLKINTEVDCLIYPFTNTLNITSIPYSKITKDKLVQYLGNLIKDNNTYFINEENYSVIIKPINQYIEESMINLDFSNCEKILKEINSSYEYRMLQINLEDNNKNSLIDQVEYAIFNQIGEEIDISPCKDVDINVNYKINNISKLNIENIKNFQNLGIDTFNIKDKFFNDICYPYSDKNSSSDMILTDRVSDIYQNFSICEKDCEYESFNIDTMSVNCNCQLKKDITFEVKGENLKTNDKPNFFNSNFGVIKCYKLVFDILGNLNNIGFWFFAILIIAHIPLYVFYFIYGISPVDKYIKNEMDKKGYNIINKKEDKKKLKKSLSFTKTKSLNSEINKKKKNCKKHNKNLSKFSKEKFNKSHPPKRKYLSSESNNEEIEEEENSKQKRENEDKKINIKYIEFPLNEKLKNKNKDKDNISINTDIKFQKYKLLKKKQNLVLNDNLEYELNTNESFMNKSVDTKRMYKKRLKKTETKNTEIISTNEDKAEEILYPQTMNNIPLILISANNEKYYPTSSNYILNNYDFNEAINYEKRKFWRIFFIYIIAHDNLLNIIFFNPPLELKPLRICILIFSYSCDFSLNALFYLTDNISDLYHYNGINKLLFSIVNNLSISLISTLVSIIMLYFFRSLTQSTDKIKNLFKKQDNLLKIDKYYSVSESTKIEIKNKIDKILKCLKIKIIFFIIFESLMMIFFFYYCTVFCHVYKNTQISWFLDGLTSYIISFIISLAISFICTIFYKVAIKYQSKILYKILLFIYG